MKEKKQNQPEVPVLKAYPIIKNLCIIWCRFCRHYHCHGAESGHRAAHCTVRSPYSVTGYILDLQPSTPGFILRDQNRRHPHGLTVEEEYQKCKI